MIKKGLCQCGCGQKTNIVKKTDLRYGWIKGQPVRFITGHNFKLQGHGSLSHNWKGGRKLSSDGYVLIFKLNHPRAVYGYVQEHVLVAEKVLGKPLPKRAIVHHVNENKSDNRKENLVICENDAYHMLLHQRMRAMKACGNPSWRKCKFCKKWDTPENLYKNKCNDSYHKKCEFEYQKLYRRKKLSKTRSLAGNAGGLSIPSSIEMGPEKISTDASLHR